MTVTVDAVVYYRVSNPTMATNNVEDFRYKHARPGRTAQWSLTRAALQKLEPSVFSTLCVRCVFAPTGPYYDDVLSV